MQQKKNKEMCKQCRKDKQRCEPPHRDWKKGVKCDRCKRMGYECSESEKKIRVQKPKQPKPSAQTATSQHIAATDLLFAQALGSDTQIVPSRHRNGPSSSFEQTAPSELYRFRPLPAPFGLEVDAGSSDTDPPSSQLSIDDIGTQSRKSAEAEARRLLARLGDQNATREILRSDLWLCDKIEQWLGAGGILPQLKAAIKAAIEAIHADFYASLRHASSLATRDLGPCKESFLSHVESAEYRFQHPPRRPASPSHDRLRLDRKDNSIREMLHSLQKRKSNWSDANYLYGEVCGRPQTFHHTHPNSEAELAASCVKASEDIGRVVADLVIDDIEHHNLLFGTMAGHNIATTLGLPYPACHLAVRQVGPSILLDLWKRSPGKPWEMDCLHRTPVHVAAYHGCVSELSRIFEHDDDSMAGNVGKDVFGLTPLLIAACTNDIRAFRSLLKNGANYYVQDNEGRSVLALAARNDSHKIVDLILGSLPIPPSFRPELSEAITAGHKDIARRFIAYYSEQPFNVDNVLQVQDAIEVAERMGFDDILQELRSIKPLAPVAYDAADSVECLRYEDYIQDTAYESTLHTNSTVPFGSLNGQELSSFEDQYWGSTFDAPSMSFSSSMPFIPPSAGDATSFHYMEDSTSWTQRSYKPRADPG